MQRRNVVKWIAAGAMTAALPRLSRAATPAELKLQAEEYRRKALANFPLKLIETTGEKALETWQQLKSAGQGSPVILGGDDDQESFGSLLDPFGPNGPLVPPPRPVDAILQAAAGIKFPEDMVRQQKADAAAAAEKFKAMGAANPNMNLPTMTVTKNGQTRTLSREETIAALAAEQTGTDPDSGAMMGDWPTKTDASPGLSVVSDILTSKPLPKVYIGVAPTDDWTTIPAYLRYGGWNACPKAEFHVAALRLWRDRYGAELIGLNADTINLRVATNPKTREEAIALARDQYAYCPDIVDQGVSSISALAADLMANDWWYFWWD